MEATRSPSPGSSPVINSVEWFRTLLQEKNRIEVVREHQLKHGMDLNSGKDLFLVLATGGGKTFILQAPLQAAKARGEKGIGLMVVPTKVLAEQQAFIASKYGLRAIAIHEDTVRVARSRGEDLFKQLAAGSDVRLAVMSPQMLRSKPMMKLVKTAAFKNLIRWLLIDEAHLVDEKTGTFHLPYRSISTMRALLSSQTTWAAVTGTATPERALAMAKALGFQPGRYINARYSIDRPNIRYVPRFLQHASSGHQFLDLSFLIPPNLSSVDQMLAHIFSNRGAASIAPSGTSSRRINVAAVPFCIWSRCPRVAW